MTSSILYLKRSLLCPLLVVVSVLTFHLTMTGETVDSLYHSYRNADKSQKVEVVNKLASVLHDREITDTLYHCSPSSSSALVDATFHYLMAEHFYDQEQYESSMEEGRQARDLTKGFKEDKFLSDLFGVLSNAQYRLGDYNEALKTLLEAYRVDKKMNNKPLISSDLNSLAAIYLAVDQPAPGITHIEKSIAIERELGRLDRLATRLGIASELYLLNNEHDKAMTAIEEAYNIDHENGHPEKSAVRLVQKASILESMSRLTEARNAILQALPELTKADNTYSLAVAYNQMGAIEDKLGHHDVALSYYKKALDNSIRCGSPKVERIAERGLWKILRNVNPEVALIHLERYATLTDSMHNEMASIQMEVMETTAYQLEQVEMDKKNRLLDSLLKWGGLALSLMLTAMLVGALFFWHRSRKTLKMQQQVQDMKSRFFNNITNELQTPLTVVMGAGEQLLEGHKTNAKENKRLGEMIVQHGKNMLELVNRLLDIEKVKTAVESPDLKNGDIVMFVKLLVDNFDTVAHQKLIDLDFSCPVNSMTVVFAPNYIRKIVQSLISNAIKFTPRNGSVHVTLASPESNWMRLVVTDTGKGIPAEERQRIFEPFSQSDNGDNGVETSVDLSLVNQLVQALNGTFTVDSEPAKGTTFTVDFPVQHIQAEDNAETESSHLFAEDRVLPTADKKHRPLAFIVENNEDVAFFIANLLRANFELRFAADGREALQNATEMVPDLIITNIVMPVMDGKELMQQLRSTPALSHIPIIALTADTSEQERLACIRAGADTVLVKPFNSTELQLVSNHLITQRTKIREHIVKSQDGTPDIAENQLSKEDMDFINRLVDVIHVQMSRDDINIDHIAAALSLNRKQLRSKVITLTGLTPVAYILQVRLNYARRMISNEDISMTAIASKCGFQSLSHFSRAFKQQFGISPLQYRKNVEDINLP